MGPDGVQGTPGKRGLVHEYPAQQYGGIHRPQEHRELGAGADTVSVNASVLTLVYGRGWFDIVDVE